METQNVAYQYYSTSTEQYTQAMHLCTVIDSSYDKGTLGQNDNKEHWYVVNSDLTLNWLSVKGAVYIILADGCTLTLDASSSSHAAVNVDAHSYFVVYGQSSETGKLVAKGGNNAAGIGSELNKNSGTIIIDGCVIEATGGENGAGIGGGKNGSSKQIGIVSGNVTATGGTCGAGIGGGASGNGIEIVINSGTVTANGGDEAAGIGGGASGNGTDIVIYSGTVTANGGDEGAGIGGGDNGAGTNIAILGGTVTATSDNYGAGIGGGFGNDGSNIIISGGDVTANGGDEAAGIGGGDGGEGHDITISGGTVTANGGYEGAGIGGGDGGEGHGITISSGDVTVNGGDEAAGIGGGDGAAGHAITISGGDVTANGGYEGAGIGGGYGGEGHDITISSGDVTVNGGDEAAGIGGGDGAAGYAITISGGTVTANTSSSTVITATHDYSAGIGGGYGGEGHDITISGGTVTVSGGDEAAGIGGGDSAAGYAITISGGTVTATGGDKAAGIGGGDNAAGYAVTVSGGDVAANGGECGAGIGGGYRGEGHDITISNGDVTATGGESAAGIGGGEYGDGYDIAISDGDVTATGGERSAGIGGGYEGTGYNIAIDDGTVQAYGGKCAAGIGGGDAGDGHDVIINGGDVTAKGGESGKSSSDDGGAGIGGGNGSSAYNITINGGNVDAEGGDAKKSNAYSGAGIGGGYGDGQNIVVNGGVVTATGMGEAAGIGGGYSGAGKDIAINGGSVTATAQGTTTLAVGAGIGAGRYYKSENITVNGGEIDANVAYGSAIGSGSSAGGASTGITFNADISVKTSSTSGEIAHSSDTDLGSSLYTKTSVDSALANTVLDTSLTTTASVTCTHSGGTVGNGGYYHVTATGELLNTDYIVKFDGTSVTGNGGAIYNEGTVSLVNATFDKCWTANGCGGAIYNKGGRLTLTDATITSNHSVYGGGSASGGALYADGGTVSVTGSGTTAVFSGNSAWMYAGAVYAVNNARGTFDNVEFEANSSRNGGAAAVQNAELTFTNTTFKGNSAVIASNDGGLGGAILLKQDGVVNLANVTFDGNSATSGGAIYAEAGSRINLTGSVALNTSSDTIVGNGTLSWDLTGTDGSTGYISDYALVNQSGALTITVNAGEQLAATYLLASNAAAAAGMAFTITSASALEDKTITVGGEKVNYDSASYTLALNSANELVLERDMLLVEGQIVVSDSCSLAWSKAEYLENANLDGGVLLVESTGNLSVTDSSFTGNSGRNGGAIYNAGQTTLDDVTFSGNTSADGKSGAIYNAGTLTLNGDVTLSTESDTITNTGNLVWNITTASHGYVSDWSKLTNTGTLTITGTKQNKCGLYTLAENAAAASGATFTFKGETIEKTITVNGDIVALNDSYFAQLTVNSDNELVLTVATIHVDVQSGETFTIQDGINLNLHDSPQIYDDGGAIKVAANGILRNDGSAKLAGSSVTGNGGVVYSEGTVDLSSITFSDNHADEYGGAIYSLGDVTIADAVFGGNSADARGGAITQASGTLSLFNVTFEENWAETCGGAIFIKSDDGHGTVELDNVVFDGNGAGSNGGAIYSSEATVRLLGDVQLKTSTDTIHLGDDAKLVWVLDDGKNGYISDYSLIQGEINNSMLNIDVSKATAMTSYVLGGNAAMAARNTFTIGSTTISANGDAVKDGDKYYTLYVDDNDVLRFAATMRTVVDGTSSALSEGLLFTNNSTTYSGNGGSLEVINSGTLSVNGSCAAPVVFQNSAASSKGGAAYISYSTADFSNCTFSGNTANDGGALYAKASTVTITNATFSGNTANNGGALYVGSDSTVFVKDVTFNGNSSDSSISGAVYIGVRGTLNVEGRFTLATETDTIYNNGTLNWTISAEEAESSGYTLCDSSLLYGDGDFVITIVGGEEPEAEAAESRSGSAVRSADSEGRSFIVKTAAGQLIGALGEGGSLAYGDSYLGLVVDDGKLKLTIVDRPTDLAGDADGITWETTAEKSMLQIAAADSEESFALVTADKGVNFYALAEGQYDVKVKNSLGNTWSDALEVTSEHGAETAAAWTSRNNGYTDLFFANASGIWGSGYVARHRGICDEWDGTGEKVSLKGKNRIADTFSGSVKNGNVLALTNDDNGDALFVDDIYTAFPGEEQSRLANIKEIRAGAGDDIVDMTSRRFDYRGTGITIRGGSGNDTIWASRGRNTLFGDAGDDRLVGGSDNDVIVGGSGNDSMHGGGGDDVFCFGGDWGSDTVEQLSGGTVTLWFKSGSEDNWNQKTMTYADGANSVKVTGVSQVTLKFGGDDTTFTRLSEAGAFAEFSSETTFDAKQQGTLAAI